MPLLATFGDGVTTKFLLPVQDQTATATVGGSGATIASQDPYSVTFASPPALNAAVVISYNPAYQPSGNKSPVVLAQSAAPVSVTGTTGETVLATVTVPAGAVGPNGILRVGALFSFTNNANNKTPKIKLGSTAVFNPVIASFASTQGSLILRNRGTQGSQVAPPVGAGAVGFGSSGLVVSPFSIDTSVVQTLTITGQLAVGTDTLTLEGYNVEVQNP